MSKCGLIYDGEVYTDAINIRLSCGGKGYSFLRQYMPLPSLRSIQRKSALVPNNSQSLISRIFAALPSVQRKCIIVVDEVYVKPSLRYSSGQFFGKSADQPDKLARTMLGIMVKCLLGGPKFMADCIPIFTLTAKFQYDNVVRVIEEIQNIDGQVIAVICDNNRINQRFFSLFPDFDNQKPWVVRNPSTCSSPLFLLNDIVHLIKSFRNNWLTAESGEFNFTVNSSLSETMVQCGILLNDDCVGKWSEVRQLYEKQRESFLKRTSLTKTAVYPSPLERQKVSLALAVINEKVTACLLYTSPSPRD